jgi:hypothetical protein
VAEGRGRVFKCLCEGCTKLPAWLQYSTASLLYCLIAVAIARSWLGMSISGVDTVKLGSSGFSLSMRGLTGEYEGQDRAEIVLGFHMGIV